MKTTEILDVILASSKQSESVQTDACIAINDLITSESDGSWPGDSSELKSTETVEI